jgi:hypothetical protein
VGILINPVLVEFACGVFISVSFKMLVWFEGKSLIFFWHGTSKSPRDALGLHKELLTQINSGFVSSPGEFRGKILVATPDVSLTVKG